MQVAEFDTDNFEARHQSAEDRKLLVKFFIKPREDRHASLKEGRPVFKDVEYIDIKIPGSRNTNSGFTNTIRHSKAGWKHQVKVLRLPNGR